MSQVENERVIRRLYAHNKGNEERLERLLVNAGFRVRCPGGEYECGFLLEPDEECPDCGIRPAQLPSKFPEEWYIEGNKVDMEQASYLIRKHGGLACAILRAYSELWAITLLGCNDEADTLIAQYIGTDKAWIISRIDPSSYSPDLWSIYRGTVTSGMEIAKTDST